MNYFLRVKITDNIKSQLKIKNKNKKGKKKRK